MYSNALDLYRSRPFVLLKAALLGILFQLLRILQVMITALALGIDLPTTFYLAVVPVVMVAILIPITFFGLGVRDFSLVYFLSFAGIAAELAFAVSILLALMTVVATLPGAWLYLRSGVHREHVQPKRGFPTDADPKTTRIHGKHRS